MKEQGTLLIGPSPHLMGKNLGQFIDSFDTVVRMNNALAIGNNIDYGSKTDILVVNDLWQKNNPILTKKYETTLNFKLVKKQQILQNYNPFYLEEPYSTARNHNLGVLSCLYLIQNNYSHIYLIGYSFYKTDKFYVKNYWQEGADINQPKHSQDSTIKALKTLQTKNYLGFGPDVEYYINL